MNRQLINNDPALLAEYSNRTSAVRTVLHNYIFNLADAKARALSLINVLKERYHLK